MMPIQKRYLGDRIWLNRLLKLVQEMPGKESRGLIIKGRHALLALWNEKAAALVDLEVYDNHTVALALLVNPAMRKLGIATQVHKDIWDLKQMQGINKISGGVDPGNVASIKTLSKLNAKISKKVNHEGQLDAEIWRPEAPF